MEKNAIKDLLYGGISELTKNRLYFYQSSVGRGYSHWTDAGKLALYEYVTEISEFIVDADKKDLDKRSKELVMKGLKGESV